ncbi:hypothetical protein H0N98_03015 [Candidatus Micrarchaeota archaeon]|nr:hypothetical protein [Candidatus Micrarchaeota archaeon]
MGDEMAMDWSNTKACLVCFTKEGISVRLELQNDVYVCPRNLEHRFIMKDGKLERLSNE